jgi:hypothetical protein
MKRTIAERATRDIYPASHDIARGDETGRVDGATAGDSRRL